MVALKIEDLKEFTKCLLLGTTFDQFLVREVTITTYNTFTMDGHVKHGYYSEEELEEKKIEEFSSWATMKPICYSLIKGKRLPISFQITLQLAPKHVEQLLADTKSQLSFDQVGGLYLNIRYEDQMLHCISGTSLNIFTMDKTLDLQWEEYLRRFLKQQQIVFVEV